MSADEPSPRRLRDHAITAWILFHLFAVTVHLFPVPPYTSDMALASPQVQSQLEWLGGWMETLELSEGGPEASKEDAKHLIRAYKRRVQQLTWFSRAYLAPIGGLQSWNMFGGNSPLAPQVMMVEVLAEGEEDFVVYQDGRFGGTPLLHRDRKVRRGFKVGAHRGNRKAYAELLARQWNAEHPQRPANTVRFYYLPLPILSPAEVRAGKVAKPGKAVNKSTHELVP